MAHLNQESIGKHHQFFSFEEALHFLKPVLNEDHFRQRFRFPVIDLHHQESLVVRRYVPKQVPATEEQTLKVLALTRIMCQHANIPATTALGTINRESGRESALQAGANVVMPNLTPLKYRRLYEIYPGKICVDESSDKCNICLKTRIANIGRTIGTGPGNRIK